ncbi:EAL domain-containing protein [Luteimonas sp. SJ-92]|uniref:EAL domain-containing protein n=1 Tax=Luteimonas salinisoli TaxID=2752307 RepID=A0A853J975_9GAMM|nr:EAL domain-containing protein [Luteimonas salinisoli]NZA25693.1 EAL domain-containing protein [Luteimonas salinisoli]
MLSGLSARITRRFGIALGVLLGLALAAFLAHDRASRIAVAHGHVGTVARGAEGLVHETLHAQEQVLRVVAREAAAHAGDATGTAHAPAIAATATDELHAITVLDDAGRAHGAEGVAAELLDWAGAAIRRPGEDMRLGTLHRSADGTWALPLAVPFPGQRPGGVLALLDLSALQLPLERLEAGQRSLITLLDAERKVLARTRDPEAFVGTRYEDPAIAERIAGGVARSVERNVNTFDGVDRIRAFTALQAYPLYLGTGLPRADVLLPWYFTAGVAAVLFTLYWAGLAQLLRTIRRAEDRQDALLRQLQQGAELLSVAQRAGHMGAWGIRRDGEIWWTDEVPRLYGLAPDTPGLGLEHFFQRMHPDDRQAMRDWVERIRLQGGEMSIDYRVSMPDGQTRHLSAQGAQVVTAGSGTRTSGVVLDVTERVRNQQRLLDAERQFRLLFDRNPLPFWVYEVSSLRFLEVNDAAIRSYGYSREEFRHMTLLDIRPPEDAARLRADVAKTGAGDHVPRVWTHCRKDGSLLEVRIHAADIDFDGRRARLVLAEDISERQQIQRKLTYRATHDTLTGLPNESYFRQRLGDRIAAGAGAGGERMVIARVVLQRLAMIGDSLGGAIGDEVLVQATERVLRVLGDQDLVARLQGPELIVAMSPRAGDGEGHATVSALAAALREPVWAANAPHYLDAGFGLALYPEDGASAEELIRNAGLAAHNVQHHATPEGMRYSAELGRRASARLGLLARLHQAIEHGEFVLYFQPIHDLASGRVAAYEALIRWPQADGGFIPPNEFIPLCEDSTLIVPLGRWVLREAARAYHAFLAAGHPPLPIAVNVSASQFGRSDLVADVQAALDEMDLPPDALEIEITESVVMSDPEQVIDVLARLRGLGVLIAIDDFGTGYSNLAYLRRLPAHILKIDRTFVDDVERDSANAAICRSIISLAELFGLHVTAEGIEKRTQLEWLRANGCDRGQGYLLGRPQPLGALLSAGRSTGRQHSLRS